MAFFNTQEIASLSHFKHNFYPGNEILKESLVMNEGTMAKQSIEEEKRNKRSTNQKGEETLKLNTKLEVSDHNSFCARTPPPVHCPTGLETRACVWVTGAGKRNHQKKSHTHTHTPPHLDSFPIRSFVLFPQSRSIIWGLLGMSSSEVTIWSWCIC